MNPDLHPCFSIQGLGSRVSRMNPDLHPCSDDNDEHEKKGSATASSLWMIGSKPSLIEERINHPRVLPPSLPPLLLLLACLRVAGVLRSHLPRGEAQEICQSVVTTIPRVDGVSPLVCRLIMDVGSGR